MPSFEVVRVLPLDPDAAWEHFVDSSWSTLGDLPVIVKTPNKGDAETKVGNKRVICFGLQNEQILTSQKPDFVEYTAFPSCIFPVQSHKGRVVFTPEAKGGTKVTWTVQYEANSCARCFVGSVIKCAIPLLANDLVRTAKRKESKH